MLNNKLTLVAAAATLAQQVSGLSAHHHLHNLEKRALAAEARVAELEARDVVVETVWEYVTKTVHWSPGQPPPAPTDNAVVVVQDVAPAPAPQPAPTTLAKVVVAQQPAAPAAPSNPAPAPAAALSTGAAPAQNEKPKDTSNKGTSSPGGAPFSGKRGIAYNDANLANTFGSSCKSCSWGYNWASRRDDFDSKYNYVPMLWGNSPQWTNNWVQNANDMIAQGAKALFSFNEPDIASQANMSPAQAAQEFQTHMNGFAGKALIGAPAVSNSGQPNQGLDWLKQFIQACNGQCKFDFCNVHWYSEPQYADTLFSHLQQAHEVCGGKPIWLTEFAPLGTGPAVDAFITSVVPKLDKIDYLDAYSYFMVAPDHLMSGSGLSSSGQAYATV